MRRILLILLILLIGAAGAFAAQTPVNNRRIEEKKRRSADAAPSHMILKAPPFWIQGGGWANYRYINYSNLDKNSGLKDYYTFYRSADLRLWSRLIYQTPAMRQDNRMHFVYSRFKSAYIEQGGTAPGLRYDLAGPAVDYAYASFDWKPWKVEGGRKYYSVGRGIAYGAVNDGASINYIWKDLNIGILAAHSLPHQANIDNSVPGYDKSSRRYFYGSSLGFTGIFDQYLYAYWLTERDHSREKPDDPDQDYRYNAQYTGLGAHGNVAERWAYWSELIRETGTSYAYLSSEGSAISAWGFDSGVEYDTMSPRQVKLSAQYAFGSGDGERRSVTNTVSGNRSGNDRGFMYFGYLPTGAALSPMLANLHMARAGFSFYPFIASEWFKGIEVSADHYRYWKAEPAGGFDDTEAVGSGRNVGYENDLRLEWRVNTRVVWSLEWGVFTPGNAYTAPADDRETVVNASVTVVF